MKGKVMRTELHYYDIYPKMVPANEITRINIKPLGRHAAFEADKEYLIRIIPMCESVGLLPDNTYPFVVSKIDSDGILRFEHKFKAEQEHYVRIYPVLKPEKREDFIVQLSVYSLYKDLYERRPYMGDHHVHTTRSDGCESPEIVPAYYRKSGFDYMAVTDHGDYNGSLEAIEAYKDAPVDLKIFPGEEVHSLENDVHIVNFGGNFSINDLCRMDEEKYYQEVAAIEQELAIPDNVRSFEYAASVWVCNKIREAKGLGIFCHPHWIANAYHVPDAFTNFIFDQHLFDAFEVVGGQTNCENEMQLAIYHDARARGCRIPIVGNSDSHGVVNGEWFGHTKTITFSKSLEKDDFINAIKDGYSAAIDCYSGEQTRVHGPYRFVSYGQFLMREFFPLHDDLCYEEGRAMKDYVLNIEGAREVLEMLKGRTEKLMNHYF